MRMKKIDREFYDSCNQWHSLCITPLSFNNIVFAVANGDAEVKTTTHDTDAFGIPDVYFRWVRKKEKRWDIYPIIDHKLTKETQDLKQYPRATKNNPDYEWERKRNKNGNKHG